MTNFANKRLHIVWKSHWVVLKITLSDIYVSKLAWNHLITAVLCKKSEVCELYCKSPIKYPKVCF